MTADWNKLNHKKAFFGSSVLVFLALIIAVPISYGVEYADLGLFDWMIFVIFAVAASPIIVIFILFGVLFVSMIITSLQPIIEPVWKWFFK